ncbi:MULTISPECIES: type III PLP-dependent enzyme domain-containing protein [Streptomycetaceae]|uniref:Lysine/ornithine decarboxylase n=1 Tax=Streptantibioticus cattleyicolor (strain ATCC 35852 / DSM 46488 / JCM 4925 / NBRC 14057 / NRRL 8057) TaxID=1003195 RepID=F8JVF8_STREN|nr:MULTISPECIES: diaminopimelate decarboxylase [Streptomycetaceae]AEW94442.1 lysine/ornithine decarboxylase [Streptantibioticus cattleyicolor NRRL 8057 = DSM 46488]MYS59090.1 diaminopimelate decarboxylase [Streptomyces sp. SID5468]CCB74800.1 Lysine/ornithine decarboxylase [Streptantibioticus cattleyicolor NRRL 8057 = DSM 46488]
MADVPHPASTVSAFPAAAGRRALALRAAVEQRLVTPEQPLAGLLDVAGVRASAAELRAAFATPGVAVTHTFAVKAAALVPVLRLLHAEGIGCEVAGPGELALARAAGVPAELTVLDSPAKTDGELREALRLGVAVNADNFAELARLDALVAGAPGGLPASRLGVRVNPQLGAGTIGALSTATATSKFGVALRDEGAADRLVRAFLARPWLTRLHAHVGSQGCPLELMARGVRVVYELAERINAEAGRRQVDTVDIGGGLPVNFASDEVTPTFRGYADLLRATVPGLFDGRYGIVTEFGRSLLAKHGTVLARVEYAKSAGGRPIAVTHAGVHVATRTVLTPAVWPLRVIALDPLGRPKDGEPVVQDVAGPCCFAGDLVAEGRALPPLAEGDWVALPDTGAYYFSTPYQYNSIPRPGVHGYVCDTDVPSGVRFGTVRAPQTLAGVVAESGGGDPEALAALG